ncbi:MAG: biosynthetic-type acetolactate synthase large subunit [Clostridiales Family XIII bacterium]|jgi:acetolactate synthase-1/2/3 large subunit|nr:biosynthetic-type acetolactate synthase large subunit [Clostridiales Family XIII bacterium]
MRLNGAKIIMECLLEQGVDTIFGYPGGQIMPLYNALYDYTEDGRIRHILTSHEQGATHAADGYARSTGGIGVCFATSGPGATNTVTGIATAHMDSSPMVVITGQVPVASIGRDSFQEVDIVGITLPITKHSYALRTMDELAPAVREAFRIARSGRPGPVLIDVPKDLLVGETEYRPEKPKALYAAPKADKAAVAEIAKLINGAKKPIIYAGGGVNIANASAELTKLAHTSNIPVGTTLMCLGCFDRNDSLSLGMVGMHGERHANLAMHNADLVIAIGARFSDRVTGDTSRFAKGAKIVHIDIDQSEISKNVDVDFEVIGDVREVLKTLVPLVKEKARREWLREIDGWKRDVAYEGMSPGNIIRTIHDAFGSSAGDVMVATDVGQHQMWTAQHWPFAKPRRLITSGGLGTMGFGLGAAIGTQFANPKKQVIHISGDGSFRMNCNELMTVAAHGLPIITFVMKNHTLGMVRQWQTLFWERRHSATDIPDVLDYAKLCEAVGLSGCEVDTIGGLRGAIAAARASGKGAVIAVNIDVDDCVWPIVPPGDAIFNLRTEE